MAADDYNIISKHGKTTTASAVSPNSIKRPKERVPAKPDMPEVNTVMICQLCSGYLIDATGIIECQHTFCKSCILKYLETSSYCPVCDVQLNKAKPHLSLRSDVILQRLVYKLVPGLLVSEIRRRRDFSIKKGIDYPEAAELASNSIAEEIDISTDPATVLTLDDVVSLSIEYYRSDAGDKGPSADTASSTKVADTNGKQPQQQQSAPTTATTTTGAASSTAAQSSQNQQQKSNVKSNSIVHSSSDDSSSGTGATPANPNTSIVESNSGNKGSNEQANDRRYLQCPAAVSVGLLKKFIRMKYGLSDDYRVDLLYNGHRESILENDLTLVDVAFIFNWKNKEEPMNIHYRIFERPVKSVTVYAGMKRPAPSVMDEPPDDDTASGPHSRSSMFSSSSAPSSKLPRLADNTSTSGNQGSVRNSNTSGKSTTASTAATPAPAETVSTLASSTSTSSTAGSLSSKTTNNNLAGSKDSSSSSSSVTVSTPSSNVTTAANATATRSATKAKVEKEEVDDEDDLDDDDEDEEEDYELVERKEHMKGIKSSRRLHNSIKESMKRSVVVASSNVNLKIHNVSSSSRSHSTDTKNNLESERGESAKNDHNLSNNSNSSSNSSKRHSSSSSSSSSNTKKRGKSHDSKESKGKSEKVDSLRLRVSSTSSTSSSEHTSDGSDNNHRRHQPLKLSISTSGVTPAVVSSSASVEKKEPLKLSLGSVLANKTGSKSPERKHHKHKHHHHHHHHKLRHRDKQGKGVTASATVSNNSQKPLKISFTLSPPSVTTPANQNQSQKPKPATSQESSGLEAKEPKQNQQRQQPPTTSSSSTPGKGKALAGVQNYNNSARTSSSAHGHLNNISKSISVSVNTNTTSNGNTSGSSTNTVSSAGNSGNKGVSQYGNKILSPAELIPKNTGIEIQPTTIPISSSQNSQHQQQQQHSAMQNATSASGNNNSHKHSHPLLPDSVHVPKSVTLIPVNPNQMTGNSSLGGVSSGATMGKVNNTVNAGMTSSSGVSSQEKSSFGSQGNQNRISAHTFTHPITNKSLHQITVTEVPPPQQKSSGSNAVVVTTTSTTHSSISVSTSNPIEKVIANAANNKPQFNGPGSMEITKIYCGTTSKDNPAKKLKDRKGLDISITGTGINVSVNKPSQNKLEEALRQKVNIAIGGGSGSISVTPAAPPNSNNMSLLGATLSGNSTNNSGNNGNKMKSVSAAAANLLSGKMPPGITIGPATVPQSLSSNSGNHNNGNNTSTGGNNNMNSANTNVGNNIMKGLGFTLPPHLTAHPHIPNNMKMSHPNSSAPSQAKSDKMSIAPAMNSMNTNNSRFLGKDSISIIGKGNSSGVGSGGQQPPPVEITISAPGGAAGKSQTGITNNRSGISIVNKSKMSNDPLASIFDITQGLQRKSPSPAINSNNATASKDVKGMPTASSGGSSSNASQQQQANKNVNMANKRSFELVSISGGAAAAGGSGGGAQGNNNKKLAKESPELKRSRSASTSSEPDKNKQQQSGNSSSSTGEIPLDLSGRSTRTSPPITIPHSRESSRSPSEKIQKSPDRLEKPGIVITPSVSLNQTLPAPAPITNISSVTPTVNNLLSAKMNVTSQKNTSMPAVTAEPFKGQPSKPISVSKLSPNQTSKIGSIVDSLAQKQAQAQQQQQQQQQQLLQNQKNSQNQQQQQNLQNQKISQNQQQQNLQQNQKISQNQQQQNLQNQKISPHSQQQNLQNQKTSQSQPLQHLQNLKNSQNQPQHYSLQQQHHQKQQQQSHHQQQHHHHHHTTTHHTTLTNASSSNKISSPTSNTHLSNPGSGNSGGTTIKASPGSNSNNSTKSSPSSSRLTSPISASSVIPMTSPSPPNTASAPDHLRNIWSHPDATNRHGKLNPMNELLVVAAGLLSPTAPHHLSGAAAAHQLASAAAAALAASGTPPGPPVGSPGTSPAFNSNVFAAQFGHRLAALGAANKLPQGIFDPHLMAAALNAHSAGMRMHNPFTGSMSPPLAPYFQTHGPAGAAASLSQQHQQQQQQQQQNLASLKIPSVPSKQGTSPGASTVGQQGKSSNSLPFSPLFSHSVPVSAPKSPNMVPPSSSSISVKSPTTGSVLSFTTPSAMPGSNTGSSHSSSSSNSNNTSQNTKHTTISHSHSSISGKSSHHQQQHHHHDSSTHSSSSGNSNIGNSSSVSKSMKINGTVSTAMPVFPPGIHNPLLPSRSSSASNNNNSTNAGNSSSVSATTTALNKTFNLVNKNLTSSSSSSSTTKGAIPNSMKISNFLPSKPKDPSSDANAEATITSGSNFGIMPPLQAKPNFSSNLTTTRSPQQNSLIPSITIPKNPLHGFSSKESCTGAIAAAPISPVKGVSGAGANKPSSMTCASLLLPDTLFSTKPSHHPTHHLLNSLSPPKGDHHHTTTAHHPQQQQQHHGLSVSSRLSSRTPSSDSVLLSPSGSASTNKTPSPGASISNKSHNVSNKDGFRSTDTTHHHSSNKSVSPTKEITSKKEIGSIPMGPAAVVGLSGLGNRNFSASSPSLNLLARPIPTIPAFLNRSSVSNPCSTSSTMNLHNMPLANDGLQQKSSPPGKSSSSTASSSNSPVKMSNEQHQHPHLPSPVFPFPGVSVPVQVKLQDENEAALPAVTSAMTTSLSASLSAVTAAHAISLKSEVSRLLAAKEEKTEEKRKRSCSLDQTLSPSNVSLKSFSFTAESETSARNIKSDLASNIGCEIPPPAKVQKFEMQAGITSTVKNENVLPATAAAATTTTTLLSENKCSSESSSSNVVKTERVVKSESEQQRESKVGEGERIEKASNEQKGDAVVVAGADPSKEISTCAPTNAASTTTIPTTGLLATPTENPCKIEAEAPSPVKASAVVVAVEVLDEKVFPPSAVVLPNKQPPPAEATKTSVFSVVTPPESEQQTEEGEDKSSNANNISIGNSVDVVKEEKPTTETVADTGICGKSDETSIQIGGERQESKSSLEIPKGTESGQLTNVGSVEDNKMTDDQHDRHPDEEDENVVVDVEMEKEEEQPVEVAVVVETPVVGTSETAGENEVNMETGGVNEDNQMEIDVEANEEEKMDEPAEEKQSVFVEERVTLTKANEDEDVDVVDVGVDEPMEIITARISDSLEKENGEDNEDAEELCIDVDSENGAIIITSNQEDNELDSVERAKCDEETGNELIESHSENDNNSAPTTCLNAEDNVVNNAEDDGGDRSEKKKDVEEEGEKVPKDPVEISTDVIKRQKLEIGEASQVEEGNFVPEAHVVVVPSMNEEFPGEQERNEIQVESTFLAVNESSNFSQDDSECGDLIIDLGPNAEENETEDDDDGDAHESGAGDEVHNGKEAAEELLTQESNHSTIVQLEIRECSDALSDTAVEIRFPSVSAQVDGETKLNEEEELTMSITNSSSETGEADLGVKSYDVESPAGEQKQDEDDVAHIIGNTSTEMTVESEEQQVGLVVESLNQDSIPNQITINPASIEVNGVIKSDMESEKREESEMEMPQDVSQCPQLQENVLDSSVSASVVVPAAENENSSSQEEERETREEFEHSGNIDVVEEDNKSACEALSVAAAAEEPSTVSDVMVESSSQLDDDASPVKDTTAEDNKNTADNNEPSSAAVDDKKNEEEQQLEQQQEEEQEGKQELSEIAMLPEPGLSVENQVLTEESEEPTSATMVEAASTIENADKTAPVHFPEHDNNVGDGENISGLDDSSNVAQETISPSLPAEKVATEEDMVTPMMVEEEETEMKEQTGEAMMIDTPIETAPTTETSTLTAADIDENCMQMETDSVPPPEPSFACMDTSDNHDQTVTLPETEKMEITEPPVSSVAEISEMEEDITSVNIIEAKEEEEPIVDVAVISATITTASATVSSQDGDNMEVTPTTSTSSVAIKLDIAANGNDDDAGKIVAASHLPSSVNNTTSTATTNSSSSLIIPSSNSMSASSSSSSSSSSAASSSSCSSSSSSSPVDVPATTTATGLAGIASKSLETFGKVAAGLLASATSTINNNNNNTSLAPTTCDAISIATTNANA